MVEAHTRCGLLVALVSLPHEDLLGIDLGPMLIVSGLATLAWHLRVALFFLTGARRAHRLERERSTHRAGQLAP